MTECHPQPPPSAPELMEQMAGWVSRIYGVQVTVAVKGCNGESHATFDGRPAWARKPGDATLMRGVYFNETT